MDARQVLTIVRDALLYKEQMEAQTPATLISELEAEAGNTLRAIQGLTEGMTRQRSLWLVNGMREAIANPAAPIPGTFSRTRWQEIEEAFNEFATWLETPLPVCGVPPLAVIYRHGNPPEQAQEQQE